MQHTTTDDNVLYYGYQHKDGDVIAEEIRTLGLDLMRANPSECDILVLKEKIQPLYGDYLNVFSAYVKATSTGSAVPIKPKMTYEVALSERLPLAPPTVTFSFTKMTEATSSLLSSMGAQAQAKKFTYTLQNPTNDQLKSITGLPTVSLTTHCVDGVVNLQAYMCIRHVEKLIYQALRTQCYPAYQSPEHVADTRDMEPDATSPARKKPRTEEKEDDVVGDVDMDVEGLVRVVM